MENKYRLILENLMDGFVYCRMLADNNGKPIDYVFLEVNRSFLRIFGLTKDQVINKGVREVFGYTGGYSLDGIFEVFSEAALNDNNVKMERYFKILNKWLLISVISIERGYIAVTLQDISEFKRAEEDQGRFFQMANDMFCTISFQGTLLELSPVWEKVLGYTRDEMLGRHICEFLHPEDREAVRSVFRSLVGNDTLINNSRNRYRCKDGTYKWLSWNCTTHQRESLIYCTVRDITSIKYYEDRLTQSEERYRTLVEASPFGIIMVEDNIIQYANQAAQKLSAAEDVNGLIKKEIYDFIPHSLHRLAARRMRRMLKESYRTSLAGELTLVNLKGELIDLEITGLRMPNRNDTIMLITRDIISRKHAEELKQNLEEKKKSLDKVIEYDRMKTDFFSNISHEFKTPLNVILGTLQLLNLYLQEDVIYVDAKLKKKFEMMKQNCYRLLRLVNNVIDITRIDSGYYEIQLANYDIVAIIKAIAYSVKEYIEAKGIQFDFDTNVHSKVIACDPDKMERIFLNLISNAIKFTKSGGSIKVAIEVNSHSVKVYVKDTGIGMPYDKQNTIFNRFIQLDKSLTKNYEGSGIGLSLVESLVKMHNGCITVNSQEGKGSEFIIELPCVTIPEEVMAVGEEAAAFDLPVERINIEFSDIYLPNTK